MMNPPTHTWSIEEWDKRRAALHEAGHLTAASASGLGARAEIFERDRATNTYAERRWGGREETIGSPQISSVSWVIGVAGEVAVCWDSDRDVFADDIAELIVDELSPTDAALIGGVSEDDLHQAIYAALGLLREHEAFFRWATAELLSDSVITNGMAAERWRDLNPSARGTRGG